MKSKSIKLKHSKGEDNKTVENGLCRVAFSLILGLSMSFFFGLVLIQLDSNNGGIEIFDLFYLTTDFSEPEVDVKKDSEYSPDSIPTAGQYEVRENFASSAGDIRGESESVITQKLAEKIFEKNSENDIQEVEMDSHSNTGNSDQATSSRSSLKFDKDSSEVDIKEEVLLDIENQIVESTESDFEPPEIFESIGDREMNKENTLDNSLLVKRELEELYIEVESIADEILELDSANEMIKQIEPHLAGILIDFEKNEFTGLKDALIHIRTILIDQKERLLDKKREDSTINVTRDTSLNESSSHDTRQPVDEVVPPPVYIAPRGGNDRIESSTNDQSKSYQTEALKPLTDSDSGPDSYPVSDSDSLESVDSVESDKKSSSSKKGVEDLSQCHANSDITVDTECDKVSNGESVLKNVIQSDEEDRKTVKTPEEVEVLVKGPVEEKDHGGEEKEDFVEVMQIADAVADQKPLEALSLYESLLKESPDSFWVLLRRAELLDRLSEKQQSNQLLEQAITAYKRIVLLAERSKGSVPDSLLKKVGFRCAERMNFRGIWKEGLDILYLLDRLLPVDVEVLNKIGVYYLLRNKDIEAKPYFKTVLEISPNNGLAQVHYGFILSVLDKNFTGAVHFLSNGIQTNEEGVHDIRFYSQLGDAYQRLGQDDKAYEVFDEGAKRGIFLSRYQRSSYNVGRLRARPVWTQQETTYETFFKELQLHWNEIKIEGIRAYKNSSLNSEMYELEKEGLLGEGSWSMMNLYVRGQKLTKNCKFAPVTCSIIDKFPPAATCKRGQVKFSVLEPNTRVYPHTGPTNCRLRSHLGLITPPKAQMQVVNRTVKWTEGEVVIFDDSFEHQVWNESDSLRLILIVDVWHPDLTEAERQSLSHI